MNLVHFMVSQHVMMNYLFYLGLSLTICHYIAQSASVSEVLKQLTRDYSPSIFDLGDLKFLMEIRLVAADITLCSFIYLWPMLIELYNDK